MTADPTDHKKDADHNTPHARRADPEHGKADQLKQAQRLSEDRQEALVDEGLEESFPASDPLSAKRIT